MPKSASASSGEGDDLGSLVGSASPTWTSNWASSAVAAMLTAHWGRRRAASARRAWPSTGLPPRRRSRRLPSVIQPQPSGGRGGRSRLPRRRPDVLALRRRRPQASTARLRCWPRRSGERGACAGTTNRGIVGRLAGRIEVGRRRRPRQHQQRSRYPGHARESGARPERSLEEQMDQAKNYVCKSCSTPVPVLGAQVLAAGAARGRAAGDPPHSGRTFSVSCRRPARPS